MVDAGGSIFRLPDTHRLGSDAHFGGVMQIRDLARVFDDLLANRKTREVSVRADDAGPTSVQVDALHADEFCLLPTCAIGRDALRDVVPADDAEHVPAPSADRDAPAGTKSGDVMKGADGRPPAQAVWASPSGAEDGTITVQHAKLVFPLIDVDRLMGKLGRYSAAQRRSAQAVRRFDDASACRCLGMRP